MVLVVARGAREERPRRQVLARIGADGVVKTAVVADLELGHHVVVLVNQVVAVHHVLAALVLEAHDHADLLALAHVDDVVLVSELPQAGPGKTRTMKELERDYLAQRAARKVQDSR